MIDVTFSQLILRDSGISVQLMVVVMVKQLTVWVSERRRSFTIFTSYLAEMKERLLAIGVTHIEMDNTD